MQNKNEDYFEIFLSLIKNENFDLSVKTIKSILSNKNGVNNYNEKNKILIKEMIKKNPITLKYVNENFKNDKEVVLEAVKKNGLALAFASKELKDDIDIVLIALKIYKFAVRISSKRIQEICKQNSENLHDKILLSFKNNSEILSKINTEEINKKVKI